MSGLTRMSKILYFANRWPIKIKSINTKTNGSASRPLKLHSFSFSIDLIPFLFANPSTIWVMT